jgi:hypothetical protein
LWCRWHGGPKDRHSVCAERWAIMVVRLRFSITANNPVGLAKLASPDGLDSPSAHELAEFCNSLIMTRATQAKELTVNRDRSLNFFHTFLPDREGLYFGDGTAAPARNGALGSRSDGQWFRR